MTRTSTTNKSSYLTKSNNTPRLNEDLKEEKEISVPYNKPFHTEKLLTMTEIGDPPTPTPTSNSNTSKLLLSKKKLTPKAMLSLELENVFKTLKYSRSDLRSS